MRSKTCVLMHCKKCLNVLWWNCSWKMSRKLVLIQPKIKYKCDPPFSSHFVLQIIGRIIELCGPTYNICFILDNTISKIIFAFIFWDFIFWYMTWDNSISTKLFSWKKMWWANIVCGLQICLVWCTNMSLWWTRRIRQIYIRMDIWK